MREISRDIVVASSRLPMTRVSVRPGLGWAGFAGRPAARESRLRGKGYMLCWAVWV
jgi:hypothetical protein